MGTCYTYLLYDDFDWNYRDKTKKETLEELKTEYPVATILAQWPHFVVVDLDKINPYGDRIQNLHKFCDGAWVYPDTYEYSLKQVEFKPLPKEQVIIENDHRLKAVRDKAYNDWLENYHKKQIREES